MCPVDEAQTIVRPASGAEVHATDPGFFIRQRIGPDVEEFDVIGFVASTCEKVDSIHRKQTAEVEQ